MLASVKSVSFPLRYSMISEEERRLVKADQYVCLRCKSETIACGCFSPVQMLTGLQLTTDQVRYAVMHPRTKLAMSGKPGTLLAYKNESGQYEFARLMKSDENPNGVKSWVYPEAEQIVLNSFAAKLRN